GGGGLFDDYWTVPLEHALTARSGGLPFYAGFPVLARLTGRAAMICGVGVSPLRREETRRLVADTFDLAALATVRDGESRTELAAIGALAARVEVTADLAFALPAAEPVDAASACADLGIDQRDRVVGVALRPWDREPSSRGWPAEVTAALRRLLAES